MDWAFSVAITTQILSLSQYMTKFMPVYFIYTIDSYVNCIDIAENHGRRGRANAASIHSNAGFRHSLPFSMHLTHRIIGYLQ